MKCILDENLRLRYSMTCNHHLTAKQFLLAQKSSDNLHASDKRIGKNDGETIAPQTW